MYIYIYIHTHTADWNKEDNGASAGRDDRGVGNLLLYLHTTKLVVLNNTDTFSPPLSHPRFLRCNKSGFSSYFLLCLSDRRQCGSVSILDRGNWGNIKPPKLTLIG
jgi:hypothetical protein